MSRRGISGQTVAITGAARGIGLATATLLVSKGAKVAISDIDGDAANAAAESLGDLATGHQLDVSDRESFARFLNGVAEQNGPVTTVINNAGICDVSPTLTEQSAEMIDRTIAVNLGGVINGTILGIEAMLPRGSGQIVNIASLAGRVGVSGLAAYSASKFGVVGLTESIRIEYRDSGLTFTCVMPGPVATDMMVGTHESPMVRKVSPGVLAEAIVEAMEKGSQNVSVPKSTGAITRMVSMLSPGLRYQFNKGVGMDRTYTEIDRDARSEYEDRITSR